MSVEFHCHTVFSIDGSGTPEALVDIAAERGVTALSITEHNSLGSAARAAERAAMHGLRYLPGVEIDAFFEGHSYHFLGFGVDPEHPGLNAVVAHNHACYGIQFDLLFHTLRSMGFPWSREDLSEFLPVQYPTHPNPVMNRYVLRRFLQARGQEDACHSMLTEATARIAGVQRYSNPGPDAPGRFCRFEPVCDAIHAAGGVCLLAHVGHALPNQHDAQVDLIRSLLDAGADGFELYHSKHIDKIDVPRLERFAAESGAVISAGSDCHHAPTYPEMIGNCGAADDLADALFAAVRCRGC